MDIVNHAVTVMLSRENIQFENILTDSVSLIDSIADFDRISVFRHEQKSDSSHLPQIHRWTKESGSVKVTEEQVVSLYYTLFLHWKDTLTTGGYIAGPTRLLPICPPLEQFGCMMALAIPILHGSVFWGFVLFENLKDETPFVSREIAALRSISYMLAHAAEAEHLTRQLHTALKDLAEANNAKRNFLTQMSHEIRTPLNAVTGLSELALSDLDQGHDITDKLEKIHSAGLAILSIASDILDVSHIESGHFEIHPAPYDTPSLINDIVTLTIARASEKPIAFKLYLDENLPEMLSGDAQRIKQIFNHLLSNAFKYTNSGTVQWHVTFERDDEDIWLVSNVRDTGVGIKKEAIQKLFMDYGQAEAAPLHHAEGTGLGLAISKRLVEIMDGTIRVESEYGKGSTFYVRLRQSRVPCQPIGKTIADNLMTFRYTLTRRGNHAKPARIDLSSARLLVVDDIQTNLDVAKGMLNPYRASIDCATSGKQAVAIIRAGKPHYDAVFMDQMMPEMDGMEAVRIIREEIGTDYARQIPIIALTANTITGNKEIFLSKGFQDFISKPIDMSQLDAVLRRWVRHTKKKILISVASGAMLRSMKSWLDDLYEVFPANSAAMTLKYLQSNRPDFILLEDGMTADDGRPALEIIKNIPDFTGIPVVLLTGEEEREPYRILKTIEDCFPSA